MLLLELDDEPPEELFDELDELPEELEELLELDDFEDGTYIRLVTVLPFLFTFTVLYVPIVYL